MTWQDDQKKVATGVTGKREWVGLTEDERQDIIGRTPPRAYLNPNDWTSDMLVYIEAKLKEKNT
jgi:hypothetical protein